MTASTSLQPTPTAVFYCDTISVSSLTSRHAPGAGESLPRILCPARLRRIPGQFSWIDQRLVRDRHLRRCDHTPLAL